MEEFRNKVKKRILAFRCMALIAVAAGIYDVFCGIFKSSRGENFSDGMVGGVSFGTIVVLGMMAVVQIIRLSKVVKDEKQLKMLYNKEHDERLQAIRRKAGMPMILIMSILMLVAGMVGSYFNEVIFYTLFVAGTIQLAIGAAVKIYCLKKM